LFAAGLATTLFAATLATTLAATAFIFFCHDLLLWLLLSQIIKTRAYKRLNNKKQRKSVIDTALCGGIKCSCSTLTTSTSGQETCHTCSGAQISTFTSEPKCTSGFVVGEGIPFASNIVELQLSICESCNGHG
jgi:hypothetical protein